MFEYTKEVLLKVSFDKLLFRKELAKALRWLKREEKPLLQVWCASTFTQHSDVIADTFRKAA